MSKNPLGKSRKVENPYATFKAIVRGNEFEMRILKTYKLAKNETNDPYARWFTVAKSPMTFGLWEYGDNYKKDITDNYSLTYASPEFSKAYPEFKSGKLAPIK
tara:strand:- start:59 stop:367 length:309 start_codon:yes stop_codon:yes gene_type:complete